MKEQAILAARIAEIQNGPGEEGDKQRLIDAEKRLKEARDGNQGISGYMKQLQEELLDTEAMIVSLAQTVETELATAMSSAWKHCLPALARLKRSCPICSKTLARRLSTWPLKSSPSSL